MEQGDARSLPVDVQALVEGERHLKGDAVRTNITAALAVAEVVKSTLGPRGMDKMLMVEGGEVTITDSGGVVLELIEVVHPAAKMMQRLGVGMREKYGDGATSSVVFAGELLKRAMRLMDMGVHPAMIISGYWKALREALRVMDSLSREVTPGIIKDVGITIFRSHLSEEDAEFMAQLVASALDFAEGDTERVYVNYRPGGRLRDSALYEGVYIDLGKRVHPKMPKYVKNARILLIDNEFDVYRMEKAKYEIGDPRRMREFVEYRKRVLAYAVELIARSGANVVFCSKNIAEPAMYEMAKRGIVGVRDVERRVMHLLEKATGAKSVRLVKEVTPEVLGYAGYVEESKIGMEEIMYVRKCSKGGVGSILLRGGNEKLVLELKRRVEDVIEIFSALRKHRRVVPGGGAVEGEAARVLRKFARSIETKEQLAVEQFAEALEELPYIIARNAGMDAVYAKTKLREWHHRGKKGYCVDAMRRGMADAYVKAILDSQVVRKQVLSSATEVACAILRVDDVLIRGRRNGAKGREKRRKREASVPEYVRRDGKIDLRYAFKGMR